MELDIRPEPNDDVREAIEAAVRSAGGRDAAAGESAWWRAGLEEATRSDPERARW